MCICSLGILLDTFSIRFHMFSDFTNFQLSTVHFRVKIIQPSRSASPQPSLEVAGEVMVLATKVDWKFCGLLSKYGCSMLFLGPMAVPFKPVQSQPEGLGLA